MNITLKRTLVMGEITEGQLIIGGKVICDTLENTLSCLPEGHWKVYLHKCHQYQRQMILLTRPASSSPPPACQHCPQLEAVNLNTVMPCGCPMLKPGNGIHKRLDGSILVGHRRCRGLLVHPRQVFDMLFGRLRLTFLRGGEVTLTICDGVMNP